MTQEVVILALTLVIICIDSFIQRQWLYKSHFGPVLLGIFQVMMGSYGNLPYPLAMASIWGGGLFALMDSLRYFNQSKDCWKQTFLVGNLIAFSILYVIVQNVKR